MSLSTCASVQLQKSRIHFSGSTLTAPNSALPVLTWPCKYIGGLLSVSKCTCKIARSYFSSRAIERQIIKLFIEFFCVLVGYHESLESTDWSIESTSTKAIHPLLPVWGQSRFSTQNCECNQKAKQQAKHNTKGEKQPRMTVKSLLLCAVACFEIQQCVGRSWLTYFSWLALQVLSFHDEPSLTSSLQSKIICSIYEFE